MRCQLCHRDRALIEAHILPRAFFEAYERGGRSPKLLSNVPGEWPKKLPIGFYDKHILCASCDCRLGVWDQYGINLFLHRLSDFQPAYHNGALVALTLPTYDHDRLKLFIISVLWRAGLSTLPAMRKVTLGPYGREARRLILAASPGAPDTFSVVLSVFTQGSPPGIASAPIMDPFRERWNGINAYRLSFGPITAYVKVDQGRLPPELRAMMLAPRVPLQLIGRDYLSSSEASVMKHIATAPQNRGAFRAPSQSTGI
jgi:hypothetical protein